MFWPHHLRTEGNVNCILLLYNCTAHKIDSSLINKRIKIICLLPNVTNNHQPADMGMIACLKMHYKANMLQKLLVIFDADGGYENAVALQKTQKRGCKGIDFGGKPIILDAMLILKTIWDGDGTRTVTK